MDRHERHTRKPRLFRSKVYPQAGLAALLLLAGTQASDIAVATPAARQVIHADAGAYEATPACGSAAPAPGMAMHMLEAERHGVRTDPIKTDRDNRVGWAFALLLAGIAVGRRAAPAATQAP